MAAMTTGTRPLPFNHDVPDAEPSEGAIAVFRTAFTDGTIVSKMLIRSMFGWAESPSGMNARTWQSLTAQDGSTGAVQVSVIAHRGNYRQRYVELESAVYAAAEHLKIPTRRRITGIGTQDIRPQALIHELELQLSASRATLAKTEGGELRAAAEVLALRRMEKDQIIAGQGNRE